MSLQAAHFLLIYRKGGSVSELEGSSMQFPQWAKRNHGSAGHQFSLPQCCVVGNCLFMQMISCALVHLIIIS